MHNQFKKSHDNERQENTKCSNTNGIKQTAENESNLTEDGQQQSKNTFYVDHSDYFNTVGESCEDEEDQNPSAITVTDEDEKK